MSFEPSINSKMDAVEIANDVAPFFRSKIMDELGNRARHISLHDLEFDKVHHGPVIEYKILIKYLSDQGKSNPSIIVREFPDTVSMIEEIDRYSELEQRCLDFSSIIQLSMIKVDHGRNAIIYENIDGISLNQISLPANIIDFYIGRISAILQGDSSEGLDENTIREMMVFLVMNLSFTDEERVAVVNLLEPHFSKFTGSTGGYFATTAFDPTEFIFKV
ncbi:MAG: hypothetical protein IH840_12840, partial [Candidatus Heimdallarchaeota archaeon]|nr:hypothetical protein [Candidatus Heimdallarchaeota archaeon]